MDGSNSTPDWLLRHLREGQQMLARHAATYRVLQEARLARERRTAPSRWAVLCEYVAADLGRLAPYADLAMPERWTSVSDSAIILIEVPGIGTIAARYCHYEGDWHRWPFWAEGDFTFGWAAVAYHSQRQADSREWVADDPQHWLGAVNLGEALALAQQQTASHLHVEANRDRLLQPQRWTEPTVRQRHAARKLEEGLRVLVDLRLAETQREAA